MRLFPLLGTVNRFFKLRQVYESKSDWPVIISNDHIREKLDLIRAGFFLEPIML